MWGKVAIAGATAAVIVGAGTAALAATGDSSSGTPSTSTSTAASTTGSAAGLAKRHPRIAAALMHRAVHGEIVTKDSSGAFVTHDGVVGTVSAVSPTAITVKAADGFSQTYTISSQTKVRLRSDGKGSAGSISSVKDGDSVAVLGTGTTAPAASLIVDGIK